MQIDHKIAILKMLKAIQHSYKNNPAEQKKWLDFEQKLSLEMESYSLGHKLALFNSIKLFLRSVDQIHSTKEIMTEVNQFINR